MVKYYFKLVNTHIVSDFGVHDLAGETEAQIAALDLVRSLRESRPDLKGKHCSISVTDEQGAGICVVPLDDI